MKNNTNSSAVFPYLCKNCGYEFYSNKPPHKISIFPSTPKITEHQVEAPKLNIICPKCESDKVIINLGKIYSSDGSKESSENHLDSQIPVTTKQKISVSVIEKIIGALSFFAGKITKADKVKKDNIE